MDFGKTFTKLPIGEIQGHTDVGITTDYILWGSDDGSGRVYRHYRGRDDYDIVLWGSQYIWFILSSGNQVYVGTMPSRKGQRGALLASDNQGLTWQKILELDPPSTKAYNQGFYGESRKITPNGWIFFSGSERSYRVRKLDSNLPSAIKAGWKRLDRFGEQIKRYFKRSVHSLKSSLNG